MSEVTSPPVAGLHLEIAGLSHQGQIRDHNEDCLGDQTAHYEAKLESHGWLLAIADGMGGHEMGEVASRLAIDTLFDVSTTPSPIRRSRCARRSRRPMSPSTTRPASAT